MFISTPFCCTGFHNFYWCLDWSLYHVIKIIPHVWGLPFEEVVEPSWYYDHGCCYDCSYQMGLVWQKILFGWWSLMSSLRTVMVQLREQVPKVLSVDAFHREARCSWGLLAGVAPLLDQNAALKVLKMVLVCACESCKADCANVSVEGKKERHSSVCRS